MKILSAVVKKSVFESIRLDKQFKNIYEYETLENLNRTGFIVNLAMCIVCLSRPMVVFLLYVE